MISDIKLTLALAIAQIPLSGAATATREPFHQYRLTFSQPFCLLRFVTMFHSFMRPMLILTK